MIKTETCLVQPTVKTLTLPNKKHDKRIDLDCLLESLKLNPSFNAKMDRENNPRQNWVELNIIGKAKIFSNGTATTTLNLPDEALIIFFEKLYNAYIKECIE